MTKSNIPTAKEILKQYSDKAYRIQEVRFEEMLQEFAKLHVEAALKAASKNVKCIWVNSKTIEVSPTHSKTLKTVGVDKQVILNAYPLTNIK